MAETTVRVEGADDLRRAFRRVGNGMPGALRDANRSAAQLVADRALGHVPVGATGRLKRSVRALASQRAGRVAAGSARVPYAAAIHWGRKRGNVGRPPGNRMDTNVVMGRPFLWESAQRHRRSVADQYEREIRKLLDRTVRGR